MDFRENLNRNKGKYSFDKNNETGTDNEGRWSQIEEEAKEPENRENSKSVSEFRVLLSQVIAVSSINLILLDLGMVLAFPTIVIPDLLKSTGTLKFTEEQASWYGSIALICQPIGSILSGFLFEPIGRKKTLLYVNIPLLLGWILIYSSKTISYLYTAGFVMGSGIGFMDAPHITYLGEICQPRYRGILTAYAELWIALGYSFVYFLGITAKWKTIAAVCISIPIISIIFISQVPESPIWLLSKGKKQEAEKSLRWLRGWAKREDVLQEFSDLERHNKIKNSKKNEGCPNNTTLPDDNKKQKINFAKKIIRHIGLDNIFHRSVLHPLVLIIVYFALSHTAGVSSTRPFMVDIIKEFGSSLDPILVTAISSVVGIIGYITGMFLVTKTKKRMLSLISMLGCASVNISIFVYGTFLSDKNIPVIPVSLFILLNYIWSFGIGQIPWMLLSEVFPFKGRGIASGISAATSYIFAFIFTKTYYDMYNTFKLAGVFGFYGIFMIIGCVFLYYFLPETEGKTLEQIEGVLEAHFNKICGKCSRNSGYNQNEESV